MLKPYIPRVRRGGGKNLTLGGGTPDVNQNVEKRGNCNNCGSLRIEKNRLVLQHSAMKIRQNPTDKRNAGMKDELPQTLKLRRSRILGARKSTVLQQQSRRKTCTSRLSGTKEDSDKCTFKRNPKNMGLCGATLGNGDMLKPYRHRDGRGRRKKLTLGGFDTRCELKYGEQRKLQQLRHPEECQRVDWFGNNQRWRYDKNEQTKEMQCDICENVTLRRAVTTTPNTHDPSKGERAPNSQPENVRLPQLRKRRRWFCGVQNAVKQLNNKSC